MPWFHRHAQSSSRQTYEAPPGPPPSFQPPPGPPPSLDAPAGPPPSWVPAVEQSRQWGLVNEAPGNEYEAAERFCKAHPVEAPRLLASTDIDRIREEGCRAWEIAPPSTGSRFCGNIQVLHAGSGKTAGSKTLKIVTETNCGDVCLLSNLPIMAGLYEIHRKQGVYYEIQILKMEGTIAIGTACRPYPEYRFPGWNRLSAGLHLDDFQKFFEDPDGGRPYDERLNRIRSGDVIGCGYEFSTAELFYTHNGQRLATAFRGIYLPRQAHDVYAAIGVGGPGKNEFIVNFGGDDVERPLSWKAGREWGWSIEGHIGRIDGGSEGLGSELPTYEDARGL